MANKGPRKTEITLTDDERSELERQLGALSRLRFAASYNDLEYDRATVTGDPAEATLEESSRCVPCASTDS